MKLKTLALLGLLALCAYFLLGAAVVSVPKLLALKVVQVLTVLP